MIRRSPYSTRTDPLFPYTTLCRSDDLGVNPLARKLVGGFEREPDADRIADDRDVAALAHGPCLADRQHEILDVGNVEATAVAQLLLEEDDGILGADRRLHLPLGIGGVVVRNHDQTRNAGVPGCEIPAVPKIGTAQV